jgi:hypothetical protein
MLNRFGRLRLLAALLMVGSAWISGTRANGQFTQNRDTVKVNVSDCPANVQRDFRVFKAKCNSCHGLDTTLKSDISGDMWPAEVKEMQAMASSNFSDKDAKAIVDFLKYYDQNLKSPAKHASASAPPKR